MARITTKPLKSPKESLPERPENTAAAEADGEEPEGAPEEPEGDEADEPEEPEEDDELSDLGLGRRGQPRPAGPATPRPPHFKFHSDLPRGRRPNDFFAYWNGLAQEFKERLTAYVYRNWPVIAIMVPDRRRGGLRPTCQIAKLPGEDAIRDEEDMLHRFGSGDYTIRLNDSTLRKSIALCVIRGLRDLENHPPSSPENLLDVLVMDDPANQSYVQGLRLRGILQERERDQEDEMQSQAVDRLASVIERQLDSKPAKSPEAADVAAKQVNAITEAVMKGLELGKTATSAEAEAKVAAAKAEAAATQQNPSQVLGLVKEVAEVLKSASSAAPAAAPQGSSDLVDKFMSRISDLQAHILRMNEERISGLEKQLAQMASQTPAPAAASSRDDVLATLEKLLSAKDKLQGLFGGGEPEREEPEKPPVWLQVAQSALSGLPSVATSLLAMSYNMAVAKTGTGTPIPPQMAGATAPASLPEAPSGMGMAAGNPQPESGGTMGAYLAMLKQIERPLINHLNDPSKSGADFAAALMDFHGRIAYDATRELGKDTLMSVLRAYPPIAQVAAQIPERFEQFVDDFLNADEILAEQEELEGEPEPEPGPEVDSGRRPPRPVVRTVAGPSVRPAAPTGAAAGATDGAPARVPVAGPPGATAGVVDAEVVGVTPEAVTPEVANPKRKLKAKPV